MAEKAAADKANAASKAQYDTDQAAYEKGLAKYQADKKAYDAALEEYNTQKLTYDSKVAEKAAADAANAKSEADYKYSWLFMKLLRRTMKLLWLSTAKTRQNMMLRRNLMMLK